MNPLVLKRQSLEQVWDVLEIQVPKPFIDRVMDEVVYEDLNAKRHEEEFKWIIFEPVSNENKHLIEPIKRETGRIVEFDPPGWCYKLIVTTYGNRLVPPPTKGMTRLGTAVVWKLAGAARRQETKKIYHHARKVLQDNNVGLLGDWNKEEFGDKDSPVRKKCRAELEAALKLPTRFDGPFLWDWIFSHCKKSGVPKSTDYPETSTMHIANVIDAYPE
ncbi:hypothetical protein FN846DRAFT_126633 [Sphaerosporella brunnea]|uniref:Uncharacterized protein n=1 Tax=Sphaerosporella brunnea TaxID=1250544 RepID=A0A5J5ERU5_9PEZI|nr:hypothetical protein FN846DRAFT_126633 [Sphaerosporella brunnea]